MTKKGIILLVILIILLTTIVVCVSIQIRSADNGDKMSVDKDVKVTDEFALGITDVEGVDLEKLKSYGLPIIIQFGSLENENCYNMYSSLEVLNNETRGKAIVKFLDTNKYLNLWNDSRVKLEDEPMQMFFYASGDAFETSASEALGYKLIKDEKRKSYLYCSLWRAFFV